MTEKSNLSYMYTVYICILYVYSNPTFEWEREEYEICLCRHIFRWGTRNCHLFLVVAGALTFISILSAPPSHTWQNAKMLSMFSCGMSNILRLKSTCCNFCKVGKIHDTSTLQVVYVTGGGFVVFPFISLNRIDMEDVPPELGHGENNISTPGNSYPTTEAFEEVIPLEFELGSVRKLSMVIKKNSLEFLT